MGLQVPRHREWLSMVRLVSAQQLFHHLTTSVCITLNRYQPGEDCIPLPTRTAVLMRRIALRAVRSCQSTGRSHRRISHLHRTNRRGSYAFQQSSHLQKTNLNSLALSGALARSHLSSSSSSMRPDHDPRAHNTSSMHIRRTAVAVLSLLVGYVAWYTYNGYSSDATQALSRPFTSSSSSDDAAPTRSVLVIGADDLQTGTFVGEGPISKTTDDDGRTVVEMLTPDQSTQKLRKMEESYFVNRGRGVLRYDLDQLPSNNPIEDDHAEKIVEVPSRAEAQPGSDWCFWGVFDGHSYVSLLHAAQLISCADDKIIVAGLHRPSFAKPSSAMLLANSTKPTRPAAIILPQKLSILPSRKVSHAWTTRLFTLASRRS